MSPTEIPAEIVLTKTELKDVLCAHCGEDHRLVVLTQNCHENTPAIAQYDKATGNLLLVCVACDSVYARIAIAPCLTH